MLRRRRRVKALSSRRQAEVRLGQAEKRLTVAIGSPNRADYTTTLVNITRDNLRVRWSGKKLPSLE